VVATVAGNAVSGTVRVRQGGAWSNAVELTVTRAAISSVPPASGVAGTAVTITGTGFGAAQGSGQVWLGTANGVVVSWSDTQVVAQVGSGSLSGNAQVLQGGAWSNAVPFAVNGLRVTSVSPESGTAGSVVTITGTGFGAAQGSGGVLLGSAAGQVVSWSDTEVVATVAAAAVSGVVRVQQGGAWSNAKTFTVPVSGGTGLTLAPNVVSLVVGETRTLQALNAAGTTVSGLSWTTSDASVVSLTSAEPPVLTAVAAGHVTITAGTAPADVTVYAGSLALGTVVWSNPGNGPGVERIVPAVPSASGVADVFAFQADGTVQAITSEGVTAWTADVSEADAVPDFQGGLVVRRRAGNGSISKLDGITGQVTATYTPGGDLSLNSTFLMAVHTDGTVFTVLYDQSRASSYTESPYSVIGIDSSTGTQKFSIPLPWQTEFSAVGGIVVGGDGYAYVPYAYRGAAPDYRANHLMLLRIDSSGAYDRMEIFNWESPWNDYISWGLLNVITNADTGVLLSWESSETGMGDPYEQHMAVTTGTSVSLISGPWIPGQTYAVIPVLQAQDGSFVGTVEVGSDANNQPLVNMIAFDASGNVRWSVPGNYQPKIATADGGVIATLDDGSAATFDSDGNATGQMASLPTYSWLGYAYRVKSTGQVAADEPDVAASFSPFGGANNSANGTAVPRVPYSLEIDKAFGTVPQDCYESVGNSTSGSFAQRNITYKVVDQSKRRIRGMQIREKLIPATGSPCPGAAPWQDGLCVGNWVANIFMDTLSAPPGTGHSEFTQMFWVATPLNWTGPKFDGQVQIDAYKSSPSGATSLIETQFVISVNGNTGMYPNGTPMRRCR